MFKSKNQYLVPLLLSGFLAVGLWIGHSLSPAESAFSGTSGQEKYQKMQDIINVLNEKYVDTLNGDALFEQTISDMLHKLDPHSNYISAKDLILSLFKVLKDIISAPSSSHISSLLIIVLLNVLSI